MQTIMRAETWISGRDIFMFRCNRSSGERWTFVVDRAELQGLDPNEDPALTFEKYRPQIYKAARRRMAFGPPDQQHAITAEEIARVA